MTQEYPITDLAQVEALTSTVRGEIVDIVDLMGPVSVAEIAGVMGRPIDSLYYHVRRLVKVGLLVETARRKAARLEEAVFDLPGRPMFVAYRPSQAEFVRVLIRSIAGMLRMAARDFKAAFEKGLVRESDRGRNVVHSRALGWFTDDEVMQMRTQIEETITRFRSTVRHRKPNSRLYVLTSILVPLDERGTPIDDSRRPR